MEKYDRIGKYYNETRRADPYLAERFYRLLAPHQKGKYLDIGCGTGNYTVALSEKGLSMIGVDPSTEMLKVAKARTDQIEWKIGRSESLALKDVSIEGIVACLTIHHWSELEKSFSELNRVLKLAGKLVIFTSTPVQMDGYWLKVYFPEMIKRSARQMPKLKNVRNELKTSGFEILDTEKYFVKADLEDLFLYSGKHKPNLYLNPLIRLGISSFSDLANAKEIAAGLEKLKKDIKNGKIRKIIENIENETGDYLFIVAKKTLSKNQ